MKQSVLENEEMDEIAARFIEGSNLIEDVDVARETIRISLACKEQYGHVGALLFLEDALQRGEYLTEEMLYRCHRLIIEEQNRWVEPGGYIVERYQGVYRPHDLPSLHLNFAKHGEIPRRMNELMREVWIVQLAHNHGVLRLADDPVNIVADFHREFEHVIHPFVDGNGRVGRLMVWYLMRYFGLKPIVFTHHDKGYVYYHAFRSQEGMRKYFRDRHAAA